MRLYIRIEKIKVYVKFQKGLRKIYFFVFEGSDNYYLYNVFEKFFDSNY